MERRIESKRWRRVPLKERHLSVAHASPRTDLAMEAHELASRQGAVNGVEEVREEHEGIVVTRVRVRTQAAQRRLENARGRISHSRCQVCVTAISICKSA
ncbi:hypothetical protein GCM10025858_06680 [Alicyclobacillus sacchari]|uniref:hypothetical protein n=1 Tax=Alicyclobacillus sacchari TaxID=392010 RepID=UPI0023E913DB|nr:hypothetical protein [Alicyclobacillus sacchari]GMA56165.1 hypothetical protein GCM10025858_06680 [Alicyclobacillus sacchari]